MVAALSERYCTCDEPDPEPYPDERHMVEMQCGRCGREI